MKIGDVVRVIKEDSDCKFIKSIMGYEGIVRSLDELFKGCIGIDFYPRHEKYFWDLSGIIKSDTGYYVNKDCLEVIGHNDEKSKADVQHEFLVNHLKNYDYSKFSTEKLARILFSFSSD